MDRSSLIQPPVPTTVAPVQICIWNQVRFEIPSDWEMLRFSKSLNEGQCAFADRYAFRLEWTWKSVPHEPDFERILSAYRASLEKKGRLKEPELDRIGDWHGLIGQEQFTEKSWTVEEGTLQAQLHEQERMVSRWGRYLPEQNRLAEFVFLGDPPRDRAFESALLKSVRVEPVYPGNMQRWRAFGLDALAPADFHLSVCNVEPARCRLQFVSEDERESWTVQRLGMIDEWLKVSIPEWFQRQHPPAVQEMQTREARQAGHDLLTASGVVPARGLRQPLRHYDAAAWRCSSDGRLYTMRRLLSEPHGIAIHQVPGMELACCPRVGALS